VTTGGKTLICSPQKDAGSGGTGLQNTRKKVEGKVWANHDRRFRGTKFTGKGNIPTGQLYITEKNCRKKSPDVRGQKCETRRAEQGGVLWGFWVWWGGGEAKGGNRSIAIVE